MTYENQIKEIDSYFPELVIEKTDLGYIWTFRCTASDEDYDLYFESPVSALAHFCKTLSDDFDSQMQEEN